MACSHCKEDKRIIARGLCSACYSRQIRGSIERVKFSNKGKICKDAGCTQAAQIKGFCMVHYNRKAVHPLKSIWKIIRSRAIHYAGERRKYPPEWEDFNIFARDVGDRPSREHQLRKLDSDLPYSKDNVAWLEPLPGKRNGPEKMLYLRAWQLRRHYNLTLDDYEEMLRKQNGVCAICHQPETHRSPHTKKLKTLSVDHCHLTGRNRGLLCCACNHAIGALKEDPELFRRAVRYLKKDAA